MRRLPGALGFVALAGCSTPELIPRDLAAATDRGSGPEAGVVDAAPPVRSGLELLGATIIPSDESSTPHATRLLDDGEKTIILNTNLVLGGKAWDLSFRSQPQPFLRCTVGALSSATGSIHPPSTRVTA